MPTLAAHEIDAAAVHLREHVGAEGATRRVEPLRVVPQPEEHLLHDLLGEGTVTEDPVGETEGRTRVAPVRLLERLGPEAADRDHEAGVARLP